MSVDASGSGYIEYTEFVAACLSLENFFSRPSSLNANANANYEQQQNFDGSQTHGQHGQHGQHGKYDDVAWDLFKFFAGDDKNEIGADEYYAVLVDKLNIIRAPSAMDGGDYNGVFGAVGADGVAQVNAHGEPLSSYIESVAPGVEEMKMMAEDV